MESISSNKRIVKNTIMLYLRMMVSMLVSLYTSRVVLQTLGVDDYGVYGVVGGVVTMFGFFNGTMAGGTARFLSYELGLGNKQCLRYTFSSALLLHLAIALLVVVICETFGIWFLENKLVIPADRMVAARYVLQYSIISMIFSVVQVPFNAAIIAHERMEAFAYFEIANTVMRLFIVYVLVIGDWDKLVLYSALTLFVSIIVCLFYVIFGLKHFEECSLKLNFKKEYVTPMLAFSGWQFYGNMSLIAITQGVNILLNMFFGTGLNAAYDIANRVKGIIMSFSTNVTTAVRPQIIKNYSVQDYDRMFSLMTIGLNFSFILMLLFCVPLFIEANYVLGIWLGMVPEYAVSILRFSLIWNLMVSLTCSMGDVQQATGDVKVPGIIAGTVYLSVFPITYISFKMGAPYWFPFFLNLLAVISALFYTCMNLKKHIPSFSWRKHVLHTLFRGYVIIILVFSITYYISTLFDESFGRLIISVLLSAFLSLTLGYYVLFPKWAREKMVAYIKSKINRNQQ